MSKKKKLTLFLVPLAIFLVFYLWYTRPMTLEQLFPELDWNNLATIEAIADEHGIDEVRLTLQGDDPAFSQLEEDVRSFRFRRSVKSLLPSHGIRTHPVREGDFDWEIWFRFDDCALLVDNFYGRVNLHLKETDYYCFLDTQDPWLREIHQIILENRNKWR